MNDRLNKLKEMTRDRTFARYRDEDKPSPMKVHGDDAQVNVQLFVARCRAEKPIVLPDERIVFARSRKELVRALPRWDWRRIKAGLCRRFKSALGIRLGHRLAWDEIHNVCPDYSILMRCGLNGLKGKGSLSDHAIDALLSLVGRYAEEARRVGNVEMAEMLRRVPASAPQGFHEALQSLRIVSSAFYLAGSYQCGFGRMDQYLWPLYNNDISNGKLTREDAKELLEEFFISLNRDADLYGVVQQGDNGQSVMLGGCDPKTGESAINDLTYLIMEAARETRLIDPKINLRVDRNTPQDLLELGSTLTQCALGFPQYSNDEVVIPALVKKGYALEDARNYTVAACWEFIIPGKGLDVVNQGAVSFPSAVDTALRMEVKNGEFDEVRFRRNIACSIDAQVRTIVEQRDIRLRPSPFVELFFDEVKYRNVGIHGAGSANAVDAMMSVFSVNEKRGMAGLRELVAAEDRNFVGCEALRDELVKECPKIGTADVRADKEIKFLFDTYADIADKVELPRINGFEGRRFLRPGSGSAQYYVWLTDTSRSAHQLEPVVGATSDGRLLDAPLGASLAPAHEATVNGVLSVFKSFAVIDYQRIMNGGPVTIELSQTVFDSKEGVVKLAQLIQYFVKLGLQQLQLNVLDVAEMEDAMVHPERHRNLIVRVWGWSGYFCELAPEFQRQIINRHRYG